LRAADPGGGGGGRAGHIARALGRLRLPLGLEVSVYAVPNNGGWYDFGYFLGIVVFGVGARKSRVVYRTARTRRAGVIDAKVIRDDEG